ncbi:MAG: SUMF1/EgtB/PvdO family nonheme iron enzyme, partial [bacterium]
LYWNGSYAQAVNVCKQGIQAGGEDNTIAELYFYMGVSYIGLGNNASAKDAFKKTLEYNSVFRVDPNQFPPNIVSAVNEIRTGMKGRLNITCEPVECNISLNGREIGSTPFSYMIQIGKYNVQAEPKGSTYKTVKGNVVVAYNKVTNINIQLEPSGISRQKVSTVSSLAGMVQVPAGNFTMGCDGESCPPGSTPAHAVYLDSFYIDTNDVTVAQYNQCVNAGVCAKPMDYGSAFNTDNNPVVGVTWIDAYNYCRWAGKRLPTEAEWEKAARGTNAFVYPWGSQDPTTLLTAYGNEDFPDPVGNHPSGASPYGVMDMAGNVWQWVNDWYAQDYYSKSPQNNPQGPAQTGFKVIRGGSFVSSSDVIKTYFRSYEPPDFYYNNLGFRCAIGGGK